MATDFKFYEYKGVSTGGKGVSTSGGFDVNLLVPDQSGGWLWRSNVGETAYIAFIGDLSGKYIANTNSTRALATGSPITIDDMLNKVINDKLATPGAITELKQLLITKQQGYLSEVGATSSLSLGDEPDGEFLNALGNALIGATASNKALMSQGSKTIMSLETYLQNALPSGRWGAQGGGGGGPTKNVTYRKFRTEDFDIAVDQMFQQTIGRGASDQELKDFVSKLQAHENKNPEVTSSTGPASNRTTTVSGGVSNDEMSTRMRDQALADPEAEGYNKGTKYLSWFQEALKAPQELGR
jgi:hypothetical protein